MTISQVQLSNTFNEFRTTFNDAANSINSLGDGTAVIVVNTATSNTVTANTSVTAPELYATNLVSGRILLAGIGGQISSDSGITYNTSTDALSVTGTLTGGNVSTGGTLSVTGTSTLTGTTTFGSGANNAVYYPANGSLILTSSGDASETGRVDANHLHADWHVGAGGDLETWATTKGDNADTHKVFAVANTNAPIDMMVVNQSEGDGAYAEFIAIHATGNTTDGWVSVGINSSNYAEGAYGITKADDAYMLYQAPANTAASGDLVIGTGGNGTGNKIIFSANGFDDPANNTQMVITPGQNIHIEIDTESSNTTTGALTVNGGIGLVGNLNIGGNVAITGTITLGGGGNTVSTSSLEVENPIIFLAANNAADTFDIGFAGEYNDGTTKYTGLVRDANDSGVYKLFNNITATPANTVDFTSASYSTLQVGSLKAVDTTASSSNTTGALIVGGGAGIAGAVNAGGAIKTTDTTASIGTTTGSIIAGGGLGVAGAAFIGSTLNAAGAATLQSTLSVTGASTLTGITLAGNITGAGYTYENLHPSVTTVTTNIDFSKPFNKLTMGGNVTFTESNKAEGKVTIFKLDRSASSYTPTFSSNIKWANAETPTWADYRYWVISLTCHDGTNVFGSATGHTI
jgi:hypothetical protein